MSISAISCNFPGNLHYLCSVYLLTWPQVVLKQSNPRHVEPGFIGKGGGAMFQGLGETRITDLTQQVQTVDRKVEDLGTKIDKIDVKFEELKQLILGIQNQGSTVINSESDATSKEDTKVNSTCMEEVHNRRPAGRQEPGDIRCLYHTLGCPQIFPSSRKIGHEEVCNFRPYNCPYAGSGCAVNGDVSFLVSHLRDDHKVDMHTGSAIKRRYLKSNPREVTNATWMLTVFHCFGQYF